MSTFSHNGVKVKFPFPPYDIQKDYMSKVIDAINNHENAMLESPTGTGKTLSLLCASLAAMDFRIKDYIPTPYLEYATNTEVAKEKSQKNNKNSKKRSELESSYYDLQVKHQLKINENQAAGRKLIYCSRTHSQLKQVVREIRKTSYRPKVMVLGSREQLCCNPDVQQLPQYAQQHTCKQLGLTCKYHRQLQGEQVHEIYYGKTLPDKGLMDIEDLYKYCKRKEICPYFFSRDTVAMIEAEVLLMPYNYMMDSKIRKTLNFDCTNCVLIIDEAHNIDSFCLESMSYDLSSMILYEIQQEIRSLINKKTAHTEGYFASDDTVVQNEIEKEIEEKYYLALALVQKIEDVIKDKLQSSSTIQCFGHAIFDFLKDCGIDQLSISSVILILSKVVEGRGEYFPNAATCFTETLLNLLTLLFSGNNLSPISANMADKWMFVLYYQEDRIWNKDHHCFQNVNLPCLGFWCMDCSIAMNALITTGISSVIFTSGTLSPMNPLINEFQIPIHHVLENLHVIQSTQCLVATIENSVHSIPLSSSFSARQNPVVKEEMIDTILSFIPSIPGNIIIFFPSYGYLNDCYSTWDRDGKLALLLELKKVYKEEAGMSNDSFNSLVQQYEKAQYDKGAILLAVCRGKASEGIDFSDNMCRCVIITGVPYPPYTDMKNKQQLQFNERTKQAIKRHDTHIPTNYSDLPLASVFNIKSEPFTGNDWYTISAHRAVNQSVGRVIRHKDDFGVILLMDERFESPGSKARLSKWIQPFIHDFSSLVDLQNDIGRFFEQNMSGYKMVEKSHSPIVSPNLNSFSKRLETNHKEEKVKPKPKPNKSTTGGMLFKKLASTKSQTIQHSQLSSSQSTQHSQVTSSQSTQHSQVTSSQSTQHSQISSSQSLPSSQSSSLKRATSAYSIDSDDELPKKDETKRQAFMSHVKSLETQPAQQVTPPAKGIKRFFHSEEVKRPHVSSNGALCFDSPTHSVKRNLFGK